jgi:hypothetical protein
VADVEAPARRRRPIDAAWAAVPWMLPGLVMLLGRMRAIDLAYHVRLGEDMLRTGALIRTDTLSFSASGSPWTDQQWLAQILLAFGHRLGGWAALSAMRAAFVAAAVGLLWCTCRRRGAATPVAAGLAIGGFVLAYANLGMRPQLLAVPLFAASLWAVVSRKEHPGWLAVLPLAALLDANVHGSFPLIVLLGALATAEDVLDRERAWRRTAAWTGVALLATFLTPFGAGAWAYVVDVATDPQIRAAVTEWAPLRADDPTGILVIASVLALTVVVARRPERVAWRDLLWLGAFLIPTFLTQRSAIWWAFVAPAVAAGWLRPSAQPRRAPKAGTDGSALPARVVVGSMAVAIMFALPWVRGVDEAAALDDAPPGITQAIRATLAPGTRLLAHQPWGSWFTYAIPEVPIFVDSRIELYPSSVWDAYDQVAFAGAGWAEALDRWDVDAIAAEADWELLPRLRDDPGWRVVFEDADGALLVRA